MSLANCTIGQVRKVARVLDQQPAFLQFAQSQGLVPGRSVTVSSREVTAEAVRIRVMPGGEVSLGLAAAAKILVE